MNQAGFDLIKKWEGFRSDAYLCPAGVWTVGYGFTRGVRKGDKMSLKQASDRLVTEVIPFENCVKRNAKIKLTENQIAALTSFVYNVGCKAFENSTLLKKLNDGDIKGASREFIRWSKAGGKVLEGLVKRRLEETDLFLKP